jgi:hypothetical protein
MPSYILRKLNFIFIHILNIILNITSLLSQINLNIDPTWPITGQVETKEDLDGLNRFYLPNAQVCSFVSYSISA